MSRKISYEKAIFELPRGALIEALQGMSAVGSSAVFRPMIDQKQAFEVADAVAKAIRARVMSVHLTYEKANLLKKINKG